MHASQTRTKAMLAEPTLICIARNVASLENTPIGHGIVCVCERESDISLGVLGVSVLSVR